MEENNKAKKFMLFGLIVLVITIAVSSTYAYYVWTTSDSDTTKIVAGVGSATVTFDGGSDINASLRPVSDKSKGIVKEIKVKADTTGLTFNMYLDITSIATELKDVSFRYEFYKGSTKLKEGNFSDTYLNNNTTDCSTNSTKHITLLTNESISTANTTYTLYIWIDGANYVNPSTMMGKEFNFKLHADGEGAVVKTLTAAETIVNLYTNAPKTTVTDMEITYNTAPSVKLMNDRLGGTTEDLNGGNVRFYGEEGGYPAWQSLKTNGNAISLLPDKPTTPFTSEEDCKTGIASSLNCSTNYSNLGFDSEEECNSYISISDEMIKEAQNQYCSEMVPPVNNYIYFNCSDYSNQTSSTCETWRIIGVFNGKLKIIRNTYIGNYAWDNKDISTGAESDDGKNDWTTARLMKLLNPSDYYTVDSNDNGLGQSLYWNSVSGKCYYEQNNTTEDCNFISTGIKNNTTRNLISEETWNLGGCNHSSHLHSNEIFNCENGTDVYSGRPTTWRGKIGLPYVSDALYAGEFDSSLLVSWIPMINAYFLTPVIDSSSNVWYVFDFFDTGLSLISARTHSLVYPTLYLNSNLTFKLGDGSESNPYQLAV